MGLFKFSTLKNRCTTWNSVISKYSQTGWHMLLIRRWCCRINTRQFQTLHIHCYLIRYKYSFCQAYNSPIMRNIILSNIPIVSVAQWNNKTFDIVSNRMFKNTEYRIMIIRRCYFPVVTHFHLMLTETLQTMFYWFGELQIFLKKFQFNWIINILPIWNDFQVRLITWRSGGDSAKFMHRNHGKLEE